MTTARWLKGTGLVASGTWFWLECWKYSSAEYTGWVLSAAGCIMFISGANALFEDP